MFRVSLSCLDLATILKSIEISVLKRNLNIKDGYDDVEGMEEKKK